MTDSPRKTRKTPSTSRVIRAHTVRSIKVDEQALADALKPQLEALAGGADRTKIVSAAHDQSIPVAIDNVQYTARLHVCHLEPNGCGWLMLQLTPSGAESSLKSGLSLGKKQRTHVLVEIMGATPGAAVTIARTYNRVAFSATVHVDAERAVRIEQMRLAIVTNSNPSNIGFVRPRA